MSAQRISGRASVGSRDSAAPVASISSSPSHNRRTAMRFWVSVPVLSVQMTEVEPIVSTAGRWRTMARRGGSGRLLGPYRASRSAAASAESPASVLPNRANAAAGDSACQGGAESGGSISVNVGACDLDRPGRRVLARCLSAKQLTGGPALICRRSGSARSAVAAAIRRALCGLFRASGEPPGKHDGGRPSQVIRIASFSTAST